ncbi:TRAP transporter large permease [Nitratireductor sp. XY-223]|uniref:TRAP transporter large permease n=1 Tax=Nitratireductor sp. XY-223 TaxID=2561926 RepID=UPI0010AA91F8|nr:TRAP transporter large permease [Nitratireductor sp. XY-223]
MSPALTGFLGLAILLALMALRMPVAFAMMIAGVIGIGLLNSWPAAFSTLFTETWGTLTYVELTVIPLFVLMGNIAGASGMSRDLYNTAYAWIGHFRGGLAHATILGCTGFAALSGSSVASALTLGRVALPEMRRFGYDSRFAAGSVAAGGTLGILIPPSTGFIIYAILTEESVGRLFLAGVVPGLLLSACFMLAIWLLTMLRPQIGPAGQRFNLAERLRFLARSTAILAIIIIAIGGIYAGIFTPVEAAAVGAVLAFLFALPRKGFTLAGFREALLKTVSTTVMIYFIIIGASVFSPFLALTQVPSALAGHLEAMQLNPLLLLFLVLAVFILLGTFLDGFAMMVLVLPIVLPIIEQSGLGETLGITGGSDLKIWFGVVMVIILEMALISPPVGMNVFVVKGVSDIPLNEIYQGIMPFWLAMLICLIIVVALPQLSLYLPATMRN